MDLVRELESYTGDASNLVMSRMCTVVSISGGTLTTPQRLLLALKVIQLLRIRVFQSRPVRTSLGPRGPGYKFCALEQFFSFSSREICHAARRSTLNRCDSASDSLSLCPLEIMVMPKQVRKCRSSVLYVAACRHLPVTSIRVFSFCICSYSSGFKYTSCLSPYTAGVFVLEKTKWKVF